MHGHKCRIRNAGGNRTVNRERSFRKIAGVAGSPQVYQRGLWVKRIFETA